MDEIEVQAHIQPTEDMEKVMLAIENIFGTTLEREVCCEGAVLKCKAKDRESLVRLRTILQRERIRDAARKVFLAGLRGNTMTFFLNKQVAYAGHVSFCEESAESSLGPIRVKIKTENPLKLVDWIAPRSR
ncbi:MAG: hypothetical protein NWF11_00595 [Candidatus Bathyarchaeota archaeon]|nr:hypothetical protein [Candidatus Bathyarchaeota archaeon]